MKNLSTPKAMRAAAASFMTLVLAFGAQAKTWSFDTLGDSDIANLNADASAWSYESSNDRWLNQTTFSAQPLKANGQTLVMTNGLLFTATGTDNIRVDNKKKSVTLNKKTASITIPGLKAGDKVTVTAQSSSSSSARVLVPTNLTVTGGFTSSTDKLDNTGTVTADGDVTLTPDGGFYVFSITVNTDGGGSGTGDDPGTQTTDNSVKMNTAVHQMLLTTTKGDIKYYNTADIAGIEFDKATGTATVTPLVADWMDKYERTVTGVKFAKAEGTAGDAEITNSGVNITEAKGWLESVYAKWTLADGAQTYRVYVKGGDYADFTPVDRELVRKYPDYGRVDIPGLAAGTYTIKVVPVVNGTEDPSQASLAANMAVKAHDRSGFAWMNAVPGAYDANGRLKADARVLYVTGATAKTVSLPVKQSTKDGDGTVFTGLQAIVNAYQKGVETRPLDIRIIGTIRDSEMDEFGSSAEGLQIKGKNNTIPMNITIEGVGNDATIWGFGMLLRNANSVELRNFAVMLCMDDCISIDTDNIYIWAHNLDFFYGSTGGDADQAKGDGTIDIKSDSKYVTVAYNRFWDSGKSSLCGMKSESGPNYIDYHHNWFDHSDSRHPRVRTMTVHVWNNYYDGVAKYGVGATMGSSVFVESNFYRATSDPMMISKQGTDAKGTGTFSGENGGMIKSFGNVYVEKGASSNFTPITHLVSATDFDCYEAATRDEQVPATYKTKAGGTTYDNFDTNPALMHTYTPLAAEDVPAYVTGYYGAGRLNKGDFQWTFKASDDRNYAVDSALKSALQNYKSTLVGIFE